MVDITLPPDQSQRVSTLGERYLILNVSDAGLIVGEGTPYKDFTAFKHGAHIFVEGLSFTSSIHSPYGLTIVAESITAPNSTVISTAGLAGEDETGPSKPAQVGQAAGALNFYVQRGLDKNVEAISFVTTGGRGGDTTTEGGQAGNGGNGGDLVRIFQSVCGPLYKGMDAFLSRKDVSSGPPDTPVVKGDAIYTAALNLIAYPTADIPTVDTDMKTFQEKMAAIGKGGGCTLHELTLAVRRVRNDLVQTTDKQHISFQASVTRDGGPPGSGKGVHGKTGTPGKAGKDSTLLLPQHGDDYRPLDDNASLRAMTFPFAHPEHCAMLLTRANIFYYMGSPLLRSQASQLFRRVLDRLSFLPLSPKDPLKLAYDKSPLMPINSVATLAEIATNATTQLTHVASGVDYNGYTDTYVPRASYTSYKGTLDTALADLVAFENAYIDYHAALSKQEKLQDSVGLALRNTDAMIAGIVADIGDLRNKLLDADYQIKALSQPVIDAHYMLLEAYETVKGDVQNIFALSVPQIINSLTSFMFAPNKGMTAVQLWNLSYQGYDSVPNIEGVTVKKDYIIGKLNHSEATIQGIKDTLSQDKFDGTYKLDDPFGTRLLAAEDEMMSFLDSFANTTLAKVIKQMKKKFDDYINAVVARNAQVLQYNVVLKLLVEKVGDKETYTKKRTELQGRIIETTDPNLAEITAYMNSIYQSSRARVMKGLDLLIRSLNFRMLDTNDIFTIAFSTGADSDKVPLSLTSTVLRSARSRIEAKFGEEKEHWGSEPAKFPPNFDSPQGKRIHLTSAQLAVLKSEVHKVDITIPTVFKETKPLNDFSGCCNVRIYRVRFGFVGLKLGLLAKSARVSIHMVHSGSESLVDKANAEHKFTHDSLPIVYSYTLQSDGSISVLDNGNIAEADVDHTATNYAAPGPFTRWTVSLADSDLNKLDFSEVKDAYFDFCGTNYALP